MKAPGISKENYVFVRYSEIMDLRLKLNVASTALLNLGESLVDTKLMSMRPEVLAELSAKLTGTSDTKPRKPLPTKALEADALGRNTAKKSKSTGSPLAGSRTGQSRKSRKR